LRVAPLIPKATSSIVRVVDALAVAGGSHITQSRVAKVGGSARLTSSAGRRDRVVIVFRDDIKQIVYVDKQRTKPNQRTRTGSYEIVPAICAIVAPNRIVVDKTEARNGSR
jgi:hypothetical protein